MSNLQASLALLFSELTAADNYQIGTRIRLVDVPGAHAVCQPLGDLAIAQLKAGAAVLDPALVARRKFWQWDQPPQGLPVDAGAFPPRYHLIVTQPTSPVDVEPGKPLFALRNIDPITKKGDLGNVAGQSRSPRKVINQVSDPRLVDFGAVTTVQVFQTSFGGYPIANAASVPYSNDPIGISEELPVGVLVPGGTTVNGLSVGCGYVQLQPATATPVLLPQGGLVFWNPANHRWETTLPTKGAGTASFASVLQMPSAGVSDSQNPSSDRPFACLLTPNQ